MQQLFDTFGVIGVGYEGRTANTVVSSLLDAGIDTVVDVRLNPISRKPGLSKTALRNGLAEVDINYLHLRALGNPKSNRAGFGGGQEELAVAVDQYRRLLETEPAREALFEIQERAQYQRVALLCFESDQRRCHRDVVLDMLMSAKDVPIALLWLWWPVDAKSAEYLVSFGLIPDIERDIPRGCAHRIEEFLA